MTGPDRADALRLMLGRVERTLAATGERFPLYADHDGAWITTDDGNWCAGYWIGLLWLAARNAATPAARGRLLEAGRARLPALLGQPLGHLFAGLNHHHAGFLGFDITDDPDLKALGLRGADAMLALYDAQARQVPIGIYTTAPAGPQHANGPLDRTNIAAVDAVHTSIPILLRAHAETGRAFYRDVAMAHVARHLDWHVRDDGSTSQMTEFDKADGRPLRRMSPLAASAEGCWSRGLAWSVAGLAAVHAATGDADALEGVARSMRYYVERTGDDLLPAWDMALDDPAEERDASAAAIIAYGLILLGDAGEPEARELAALGERILDALLATCLVTDPAAPDAGAIRHGCYRRPRDLAVDNELIWTDFYVCAALDRLANGAPKG